MSYLLDTNTCIRYLNGRSPNIRSRIANTGDADIFVCSVVKAELYFGAARSRDPVSSKRHQDAFLSRFTSLSFDDDAAREYGLMRADLAARGQPIGPNDLLIASIAVAHQLVLVTNNTAEFGRVLGLTIEDWEADSP